MIYVPVVDLKNKPLMPTTQWRAARWIKSGKATPFWKKGVFCVRLNQKPSDCKKQPIAVGIDPGSKKEGYTVKSEAHTFLNIQADAITCVKKRIATRQTARRARRTRNGPYRAPRPNRSRGGLPPSTRARWQWKLRILSWLQKLFTVSHVIVEDINAKCKPNYKKWNVSFGPLQVGKNWFYQRIKQAGFALEVKHGWETKSLRDSANLKKTTNKLSKSFDAHCVDSWVLANSIVGGHIKPDNKQILYVKPFQPIRRQLHVFQPTSGGLRKKRGGTISAGLKKGSLVKHKKHGLVFVGGSDKDNKITVRDGNGRKISGVVKAEDCKLVCFNSWSACF